MHGTSESSDTAYTLVVFTFHIPFRELGVRARLLRIETIFYDASEEGYKFRLHNPEVVATAPPRGGTRYCRTERSLSTNREGLEPAASLALQLLGGHDADLNGVCYQPANDGNTQSADYVDVHSRFGGGWWDHGIMWLLRESNETKRGIPSLF
jgi:hypothetical protein